MRIANLKERLVLVFDAGAVDVEQASGGRFGPDPQSVYDQWNEFTDWAKDAPVNDTIRFSVSDLGAPAPAPRQIFGIGLNYRDHAAEAHSELPTEPLVFTKFVTSLTGAQGIIELPGDTVDWEAELVVVVGATAHQVPAARGWDYVAGLTVGQDITERTVQLSGPVPQFNMGKSFPGFGPTGPWIVTPDELTDRDDIPIGCSVNGESMQKGRTGDLVFSVPQLIAELSAIVPLLPGDIIFTGTPAGVGGGREPKRYLIDGDELVTYATGIGEMRHRLARRPLRTD